MSHEGLRLIFDLCEVVGWWAVVKILGACGFFSYRESASFLLSTNSEQAVNTHIPLIIFITIAMSSTTQNAMLNEILSTINAAQHSECVQCRSKLLGEVKPMLGQVRNALESGDPQSQQAQQTLAQMHRTVKTLWSKECSNCRRHVMHQGKPLAQRIAQHAKPLAQNAIQAINNGIQSALVKKQ